MAGRLAKIETLSKLFDLHHFSEWAHFLDLAQQFRRYLDFIAPKNGVFRQDLRGNLHI